MTFRIGLVGLEKWQHQTDRTISQHRGCAGSNWFDWKSDGGCGWLKATRFA